MNAVFAPINAMAFLRSTNVSQQFGRDEISVNHEMRRRME
jgi:hypothetical protein